MGAKRKNQVVQGTEEVKHVADPTVEPEGMADENTETAETPEVATETEKPKAKKVRNRSGKYVAVRSQVDKTKKYDIKSGIELVKKLSYSSFDGTLTAHVVVKEVGLTAPLTLPYSTGKSVRAVIVDDAVLKDIEAGTLDFDVLIAHPQYMPKLAKFAPTLGPKGLMPNPKNGTLTPNPEAQKKKLEAGTVTVKTEKKAPLINIRIGKVSTDTKQLAENVQAIIKALGTKLERLTLAASMSPGVKIDVTQK